MKRFAIGAMAVLALASVAVVFWVGGAHWAAAGLDTPAPGIAVQTETPAPAIAAQAEIPAPAVTPPALTPSDAGGRNAALAAAVAQAMADFPGRYSVAVQDLASDQPWVLNGDERYHPASTIKMPVTLYALHQYQTGKLKWTDLITYTEADYESPGGGAFEQAPFGGRYPVENLVNRALTYSNNVAVNMLGRHLGWQNIRDWTRTIGGELYRSSDGTPEVTVTSELGWWLHLDRLSRESPKDAELLLQPLRAVTYSGRIPQGLPAGVRYLHKFGSYDGFYHDGGIVYGPKPYALVVLTSGGSEEQADEAIARVSEAVYAMMAESEPTPD